MVRWLNHRYSCFLFLLSIQDSSRALNRDKQPSLPQTWLLVSALSILGFTTFGDSMNQIWQVVTRAERRLAGRLCALCAPEKNTQLNQPAQHPSRSTTHPLLVWYGHRSQQVGHGSQQLVGAPLVLLQSLHPSPRGKNHYAETASLLPPVLTFAPLFSAVFAFLCSLGCSLALTGNLMHIRKAT